MNDKERCQLLEMFANETSIAKGGGIKVEYSEHYTRFTPTEGYGSFKCEDSKLLGEIIMGATHFLFWLNRNGYKIRKGVKKGVN